VKGTNVGVRLFHRNKLTYSEQCVQEHSTLGFPPNETPLKKEYAIACDVNMLNTTSICTVSCKALMEG
jgi:hypothetical protein